MTFVCAALHDNIGPPGVFESSHLQKILEVFQHSHLRELCFSHVDSLGYWSPSTLSVPSLRSISLSGTLEIHSSVRRRLFLSPFPSSQRREIDSLSPLQIPLQSLYGFLHTFPLLQTLTIEGFSFSQHAPFAVTPWMRSPSFLALEYPLLAAFLLVVEKRTRILEVRYRDAEGKREMRWVRRTDEEEFEAEGWQID
jgi:hypothetical protein